MNDEELKTAIKKCFTDTQMEKDEELTLFDTDQTIENILNLIKAYGDTRELEGREQEQRFLTGALDRGENIIDWNRKRKTELLALKDKAHE